MFETSIRSGFQYSQVHYLKKNPVSFSSTGEPPSQPPSSSGSRISPALLFIVIILAAIFIVSGLLHLLVRFLLRKGPFSSRNRAPGTDAASDSEALQRQLRQLFHLHDSGLDQAFIDALPVFYYKEIVGAKEPFDCGVCLCEFSDHDKLRLLPLCGHAFHLSCIDTWLMSNSTCPLCRGVLFAQGLAVDNPMFDFFNSREEEEEEMQSSGEHEHNKPSETEVVAETRVFRVRLGKFVGLGSGNDGGVGFDGVVTREEGESSRSNLDARRCFSMGSFQYVVVDDGLRVALSGGGWRRAEGKSSRGRGLVVHSAAEELSQGKKLHAGSKGESFSVSKIWLWSNKKGKLPVSSDESNLGETTPWNII
ncbi:hypothetical protein HPP92_010559 [Vanilla planifolia]|uniref:RING-type E3 ubiquitin transferase n=1 Tax=Vanilla planifolia TaxID=51239 RepID=A0A835QYV1_VANPL|nr:hypothetical protein HPP92_010559 [Vanilla planifolia]